MLSDKLTDLKAQFPIFTKHSGLVYFDNAATTQKPREVIDAMKDFYESQNANIHRGVYALSAQATQAYEAVRAKVATFLGAASKADIAFTAGTTDSINRIAFGYLKDQIQSGDNIVLSVLEHHANLIPWQQLAKSYGVELRFIPIDQDGNLDISTLKEMTDKQTKLVAVTAISNSVGTVTPLEDIIEIAHSKSVPVLVDGAQSTGLYPMDMTRMEIDFYTFSAHKMFGPFGVGALYVAPQYQSAMQPTVFGGGMINRVKFETTTFLGYPQNQEGGTPNVAGVIGLGAAVDFCQKINTEASVKHLKELAGYAKEAFMKIEGLNLVGQPKDFGGIVSFTMDQVHPHDLAQFLGAEGIAVRAGHHCTQPLLESMGLSATTRASFSIYNSLEEIDQMVSVLEEIKNFWA